MPEFCKNCTTRDANNNTCINNNASYNGKHHTAPSCNMSSNSSPNSRHIQVTAKVMFGSVQAISHMKMAEKAARENKRT